MAFDPLLHDDDGRLVAPDGLPDWEDWVSATALRHHVLGDPLLDWLTRYGADHGFRRDTELPGYDERTDFTAFLFAQGRAFEQAVVALIADRAGPVHLVGGDAAAAEAHPSREYARAQETVEAMRAGVPVIAQAVLWDAQHRTYGVPDLLVRSDHLDRLVPGTIDPREATLPAPALAAGGGAPPPWHYRVVDIKFTTLHLLRGGEVGNSGSAPAYKAQLHVYNRALGRLQGMLPTRAYLLGRGWEQARERGHDCLDRLGPVPHQGEVARGLLVADAVERACAWHRRLRAEGATWALFPEPATAELYPNGSNQQDGPWHAAKREIAERLEDLTLLWQVGVAGREAAHGAGIRRWTDPRVTPAVVGVGGERQAPRLAAILRQQAADGPPVAPAQIAADRAVWHTPPPLEFYVDFETMSDLADDFSRLPARGGQALIFMIGCGWEEEGRWQFRCFVAERADEAAEAKMIDRWFAHMAAVRDRLAPGTDPPVVHWSPAEVSSFERAYNSARQRHPDRDWPNPHWYDFLSRVVREEPVTVRGALGFGLKPVARALHRHGRIETSWRDGPGDGLGAMVAAWRAYADGPPAGEPIDAHDLMRQVVDYNEVDCRVMWEAVGYLRAHH